MVVGLDLVVVGLDLVVVLILCRRRVSVGADQVCLDGTRVYSVGREEGIALVNGVMEAGQVC